jgi:hypothetical protein
MAAFFLEFIKTDSIGTFSIAHLVNADRYGMESDVCKSIAEKCFQAVRFPILNVILWCFILKHVGGFREDRNDAT